MIRLILTSAALALTACQPSPLEAAADRYTFLEKNHSPPAQLCTEAEAVRSSAADVGNQAEFERFTKERDKQCLFARIERSAAS